jgi:hypothetical protein
MTTPNERTVSQPANVESFDQKLSRALERDPLAEVERDWRNGWPDRWPNNITGNTDQSG